MSIIDVQDRYDSFQRDAVQAIVRDFTIKYNGRYLLVIPTGGGKTFTAVKAILQLFDDGVLNVQTDKILWLAHRIELIRQAKETFQSVLLGKDTKVELEKNIKIRMILEAARELPDTSIKLAVIDEVHHAAAPSYQPFFQKSGLGILGLTATPSRHDGKSLDFERESFSIGFPDLIKKGIILKPEVVTVKGGTYELSDLDNEAALEILNNDSRNQKIVAKLTEATDQYKKIIIYLGTQKHVKDLYTLLINTSLINEYQSISYIIGGGENSRNQTREDYINQEKNYDRSIIINAQVLTEGYDDPKVNTVVMATPSRSKLYYMQAMGRAVRRNPEDSLKKAYVLEVEDTLPNITYRIDNRWLYSDISDALEPAVLDKEFSSKAEFAEVLSKLFDEFSVPEQYRSYPVYNEHVRYSVLMFSQYIQSGVYGHIPLILDNDNRTKICNLYNFISERMTDFIKKSINIDMVYQMVGVQSFDLIPVKETRKYIYQAMENAHIMRDVKNIAVDEWIKQGHPWITFIAFQFKTNKDTLDSSLIDFIKDMVNKEDIEELLITKSYEDKSFLVRLPLPLKSYIGKILNETEFKQVSEVVEKLAIVKENDNKAGHILHVDVILQNSILPIEMKYVYALTLIVRESLKYYISL